MLSSSAFQLITAFTVFIVGLFIVISVRKYFKSNLKRILLIYFWHTLFCFIYLLVIQGDAQMYFTEATLYGFDREFQFGTSFIIYFTTFLVKFLGLSFLGCFLIFNIFGSLGLIAFDSTLRQATQKSSRYIRLLASLIIFLPSISFWSSALGKDAISFMAVCLALWATLNLKKRMFIFAFAIISMFSVRPHIAAIMLVAFALSFIFDKQISIVQRLFLGVIAIIVSSVAVPFSMQLIGFDINNAEEYIEQRQSNNMEGGSSLDISSMSLPMQVFTYLFRPLPFDAHNIFAFLSSIDNILLIFLFIIGLNSFLKKSIPVVSTNSAFLWFYSIICLVVLATTTANLGISMRQKWMFLPCLIFLLFNMVGRVNKATANKIKKKERYLN